MACVSAELDNGVALHICRTDGEKRPGRKRRRMFWCFSCRKRQLHTLMGFYPAYGSYYDPHFWWECPTCHKDCTDFPGRAW